MGLSYDKLLLFVTNGFVETLEWAALSMPVDIGQTIPKAISYQIR